MAIDVFILLAEAISFYLLVLGIHSLRSRFSLGPFYALIGGLTALMSWVTDAGVQVQAGGITFMIGSTVFYTALLLAVFVLYIFDGPSSTRIAILTVAGVSALTPIVAALLHVQVGAGLLGVVPAPSFRINVASILTTITDLVFLAIAWEFFGRPKMQVRMWLRAFLTLLGVMILDVVMFNTGAFAGTNSYLSIMQGTLFSRIFITLLAFPFLYGYLHWQNRIKGTPIDNRPVLAILTEFAEVQSELARAQQEIQRRKKTEEALKKSERKHRILFEASADAIMYIKNGRYVDCNQAAVEISGLERKEELLGREPADFAPRRQPDGKLSAEKQNEMINIALKEGTHRFEWERMKTDGESIMTEVQLTALTDDDGVPILNVALRDITEKKAVLSRLSSAVIGAESDKELVSLCAGCRKVRETKKEGKPWVDMEKYLSSRFPDAQFSHGMCPDCMNKYYPDFNDGDE